MAISIRLAAARRNTLTACLCAAIAASAASAGARTHAHGANVSTPNAAGRPAEAPSRFAMPSATPLAHTVSGNVISVSSCADDGSNGTLRSAVDAASDGDTIDMSGLSCSLITLQSGQLVSPVANLTLQGPGVDALTIDGNNADRILQGTNLDVLDLTIAHGVTTSGIGGCVFNYGDLTLIRTRLRSCVAVSANGAIGGGAAVLGKLSMDKATISSSKAVGSDNAAGGGALVAGAATLNESTISGNSAEASQLSAYGGGLFANDTITLHASTIDGNTAYSPSAVAYGGGLHSALADIAVLDGSAVTNNSAGSHDSWSYGGGINSGVIANPTSATVTVSHSTISGNTASSHCNSCFVFGGGVQAANNIVAEYSTIEGNKAVCADASSACKAAGGGLSSTGVHATSTVLLSNATISTNEAIAGTVSPAVGIAGGVLANASARVIAHNATIAFNHASTSGAGMSASSAPNPPSELISTIVANNDTDAGPSDIGLGLFANNLTIGGSSSLVMAADANVTLPNDTKTADPHLQSLTTDDGGATAVHPLAPDSIAIDAGANPDSLGCDQRGIPYRRTQGPSADIGAYEYQGEPHLFTDGFDGPGAPCLFAP